MKKLEYQGVFLGNIDINSKPVAIENWFNSPDSMSNCRRRCLILYNSPAFLWVGANEPRKMWRNGDFLRGRSILQFEPSISEIVLKLLLDGLKAKFIMAKVDQFWDPDTGEYENDISQVTIQILAFYDRKNEKIPSLEDFALNLQANGEVLTSDRPEDWFAQMFNEKREEQKLIRRKNHRRQKREPTYSSYKEP